MTLVTLVEAAHQLGVSVDTVRRRLQKGELKGQQQPRPSGHIWLVELDEELDQNSRLADRSADAEQGDQARLAACQADIHRLEEMVAMLQAHIVTQGSELEAKNQQISELHVLLQQAQAALPAARGRPWWRFWGRG
jgi:septal ring factor EnvC (AmiA/AmiB activator)